MRCTYDELMNEPYDCTIIDDGLGVNGVNFNELTTLDGESIKYLGISLEDEREIELRMIFNINVEGYNIFEVAQAIAFSYTFCR